jgi:hypothetical protein
MKKICYVLYLGKKNTFSAFLAFLPMGRAKMSQRNAPNLGKMAIGGIPGHPFIIGASSDAFFVMRAGKSAILAGPILDFLPVR